jgi:E3 ubiquitin-protein ligase RNF5
MDQETQTFLDSDKDNDNKDNDTILFECNICLDTASQPVITLCGHLFCWACVYQWMISPTRLCNTCPVCKSVIEKEKLIPIYTRGGTNVDPRYFLFIKWFRTTIPERPQGQRTEAPRSEFFQGFQFNAGTTTVFHFGAFGIFPLFLQLAYNSRNAANLNQGNSDIRGFLSRLFLMIGILLLFTIVLY